MQEIKEKLTKCVLEHLSKGISDVDTEELGEVIDMIKDISMAMYYEKMAEKMHEEISE